MLNNRLMLFKCSAQRVLYLHASENLVKIITLEKWFDGFFSFFFCLSWVAHSFQLNILVFELFFCPSIHSAIQRQVALGKIVKIIKDIHDIHVDIYTLNSVDVKVGLCGSFSPLNSALKLSRQHSEKFHMFLILNTKYSTKIQCDV